MKAREQLENLKLLKKGWLDGDDGVALDPDGLDWLIQLFDSFPDELLDPHLFPMPDGAVQMEEGMGPWFFEAIFDIKNRKISVDVSNIDTDQGFHRDNSDWAGFTINFFNFIHGIYQWTN
jgi:hypothetical protein